MASTNSPVFRRITSVLKRLSDEELLDVEGFIESQSSKLPTAKEVPLAKSELLHQKPEREDHDTMWLTYLLHEREAKYMVAVDFDGVLHANPNNETWEQDPNAAVNIKGKPIHGAIKWLKELIDEDEFLVVIHSSRLTDQANKGGTVRLAISAWLTKHGLEKEYLDKLVFSGSKPVLHVLVDDRGYRFTGDNYPSVEYIKTFQPWDKK